jgi:hypothetical protein
MLGNRSYFFLAVLFFLAVGCTTKQKHHSMDLPDPSTYQADFSDIDDTGNGLVSWEEFKGYFPNSKTEVFDTIDLNNDGSIDRSEWGKFDEAHGQTHKPPPHRKIY